MDARTAAIIVAESARAEGMQGDTGCSRAAAAGQQQHCGEVAAKDSEMRQQKHASLSSRTVARWHDGSSPGQQRQGSTAERRTNKAGGEQQERHASA